MSDQNFTNSLADSKLLN